MNDENTLNVLSLADSQKRIRELEETLKQRDKKLNITIANQQGELAANTRKRIEHFRLIQKLKQAGESPGDVVLRALKFMDSQSDTMRRRPTGY